MKKPKRWKTYRTSTNTDECRCPVCAEYIDGATNIGPDGGRPRAGDYSICVYCLVYLVFVNGHQLRVMTNQEWEELPLEIRLRLVRFRRFAQANPPARAAGPA